MRTTGPRVSAHGGGAGGPGGRPAHLRSRFRGSVLHSGKVARELTPGAVGFRGYADPNTTEPGATRGIGGDSLGVNQVRALGYTRIPYSARRKSLPREKT